MIQEVKPTKEDIARFSKNIDANLATGIWPETIYKYRCWNDKPADNIIRKGIFYLAKPSQLAKDYSELALPIDQSLITEEYLVKYSHYLVKRDYPELKGLPARNKASKLRMSFRITDPRHQEELPNFKRKINDERYGVFCSSMSINNSFMWEGYACLSTGFAVGLSLKEVLIDERIFGAGGIVEYYRGDRPRIPPLTFSDEDIWNRFKLETFSVPIVYNAEDEFRITRHTKKLKDGQIYPYNEDDREIKINDRHLKIIYLGANMNAIDTLEFVNHCKLNFPETKIERYGSPNEKF